MDAYILISVIVGVVIGGVLVFLLCKRLHKDKEFFVKKENLIDKQVREKEENLRKIMDLFKGQERVANNEVERMLGVSDATAERYLQELEKAGKIRQVGKTGMKVYYQLVKINE